MFHLSEKQIIHGPFFLEISNIMKFYFQNKTILGKLFFSDSIIHLETIRFRNFFLYYRKILLIRSCSIKKNKL